MITKWVLVAILMFGESPIAMKVSVHQTAEDCMKAYEAQEQKPGRFLLCMPSKPIKSDAES